MKLHEAPRILTLSIAKLSWFLVLILAVFSVLIQQVQAEDKLSLTVTPPLIKINMDSGEFWSSSVKIVNINPRSLTIYAQVLDFKSGGGGGVEFIQKKDIQEGESFLLSQWLEINQGPFEIPAFQSKEISFSIKVPKDAEPGGHYAAILVGTKPTEKIEGTAIQISSLVASLIMLNVQGEIVEEGRIREFSTEKIFYQKPEVEFTVRFENAGNVHVQPQGEIKIYNFFGKERGTILINQKTDFGNVLPNSIRKWNFEWKGEQGFFDVGRYKAVLVLGFGEEAKQTVSSILYFWVVPIKPTLGILGGFTLFIFLTALVIRAYIKRAIFIAQKEASQAVIDLRQKK